MKTEYTEQNIYFMLSLDIGLQMKGKSSSVQKWTFGDEMQTTARLLKVRNEVITGEIPSRERKWYGHVVHIAGKRWHKRIKHINRKEDDNEV
jgi:hypothetical protein